MMGSATQCIMMRHDLRLVALALAMCVFGAVTTARLFVSMSLSGARQRRGWLVLAAVCTGTTAWCTHFIAMLSFRPGVTVPLDAIWTAASLPMAIGMAAPGLLLAGSDSKWRVALGGATVGLAFVAMHYAGMAAYQLGDLAHYEPVLLALSVLSAPALTAASFLLLRRRIRVASTALLACAVLATHFLGMAALRMDPTLAPDGGLLPAVRMALALCTGVTGVLLLICAAASMTIELHRGDDTLHRLQHAARHDGLTELPNRMAYISELLRRLRLHGGEPRMAVVNFGLARFKVVNDTFGHQAGDQVLMVLAARLDEALLPSGYLARLGGDEFAALLSYREPVELQRFLARLADAIAAPFVLQRFTATIGAHIGVAVAPLDGEDANTLMARADLAMCRARAEHVHGPCFYDPTMDDAVRDRRELAEALRDAIDRQSFELHYQVQAAIGTGEIIGYEALIRWPHEQRGMVPPSLFIPLCEQIGEIVRLSNWILREACREAVRWRQPHKISVNLSALHLADPQLVPTVRAALKESGLAPGRLMLELTESAIIRNRVLALRQLQGLRQMGVQLALDDFGVGYSSLDVLRSFVFDCIKLDASFVAAIEHDAQAVAILRSVAGLGSSLGIPVLAEGIENLAQLRIAAREGCGAIQGYLIGRPRREMADAETVRTLMEPWLDVAQASGVPALAMPEPDARAVEDVSGLPGKFILMR